MNAFMQFVSESFNWVVVSTVVLTFVVEHMNLLPMKELYPLRVKPPKRRPEDRT